MKTPLNTKIVAWLVKKFLNMFEFKNMVFYAVSEDPFGFVLMRGNPLITTQGISIIINLIAEELSKSYEEVIHIIASYHHENVN